MNHPDDPLDRLLASAARAPRPEPGDAPFTVEARVLGGWRAARTDSNDYYLLSWLRRAAFCAAVLAVASLAWNYRVLAGDHNGGGELAVADATMKTGVEP